MVQLAMTDLVRRTCTEIGEAGSADRAGNIPLESFREADAYVLLGAPGAGKTEAFKYEARQESGCLVSARDFRTFRERPEWHDATLYIDGLDEVRAGTADGRTPLDDIRAKLDQLGSPRFRLSCREADWFGASDRNRLGSVSRSGKVTVLRLDPLTDRDVVHILKMNCGIDDPETFVSSSRERGVDHLLKNPQSLELLARAVKRCGVWPETRMQTFEMACLTLLEERNTEHQIAEPYKVGTHTIIQAAGRLCAVQLLSGSAGYTLPRNPSEWPFVGVERISGENQQVLCYALATKLFEGAAPGQRLPVHRQIGEFLAARYLQELINDGLPVERILALMTGYDGIVVSELRGLSAWLAAHGTSIRTAIIERDALGTALYGDTREFRRQEKLLILENLQREAEKNPGFVVWVQQDSRLGDIATPDMVEEFEVLLANPRRDDGQQSFVLILARLLLHAAPSSGFARLMEQVVRDGRWKEGVRYAALRAFARHGATSTRGAISLRALLEDIDSGGVSDADHELRGVVLAELYPAHMSVWDVLAHLKPPTPLFGQYRAFWTRHAPERSSAKQISAFLDAVAERFDDLRSVFAGSPGEIGRLGNVPAIWLWRLLESSPNDISAERLFDWLALVSRRELRGWGQEERLIGRWLTCRPDMEKELISIGVKRCTKSGRFGHCMYMMERSFLGAERPSDFGTWCLEKARAAASADEAKWFMEQVAGSLHLDRHAEGLSLSLVMRKTTGRADLEKVFEARLSELQDYDKSEKRAGNYTENNNLEKRREWRERLKQEEEALHNNECSPTLLYEMANVYFGEFIDVQGDTPRQRLEDLLGDDDRLIDSVLQAFRRAIRRKDTPSPIEIMKMGAQNRFHMLSLPIAAGLEELFHERQFLEDVLSDDELSLALTTYFTLPLSPYIGRHPGWYKPLLRTRPNLVGSVLIGSTQHRARSGKSPWTGLYDLALDPDHTAVARIALLPVLGMFPTRCTRQQLSDLGVLIGASLLHCDDEAVLKLVEKKLARRSMNVGQRVYWLAAGFLLSSEGYTKRLVTYVSMSERRIRHLAAFVSAEKISSTAIARLDTAGLKSLIRLLGKTYRPYSLSSTEDLNDSPPTMTADCIRGFIERLASIPSASATKDLQELSSDDDLQSWRISLANSAYQQSIARREAEFRHCEIGQVIEVLDNRRPANAADLAALAVVILNRISRNISDGDASDWRKYWNVDPYNRPLEPKPEAACRDYLLHDLRHLLEVFGIEVQPEARYANDTRADIRISCGGHNLPVEIKRSCHRDLWSTVRKQLVDKYARDPGASGHGIYLVFWYGDTEACRPVPGLGKPPKSAAELLSRLRDSLSPEGRLKISICVIDVSKPLS